MDRSISADSTQLYERADGRSRGVPQRMARRSKVVSGLLAVLPGKTMTSGIGPTLTLGRSDLLPYAAVFFGIIAAILRLARRATLPQP